jgi:hypothetical protein
MRIGAGRYQDVLAALAAAGLTGRFTQTGGMNAALKVTLEGGRVLLITDADEALSWDRAEQHGWGVGLYADEELSGGAQFYGSCHGPRSGPRLLRSEPTRVHRAASGGARDHSAAGRGRPDLVICPFLRERVPIGEALIAAAAMACSSRVFGRGLGGGP